MPDRLPVGVVGGGVSGIATAHFLQQGGREPVVLERDPQLGGRIAPGELRGRAVECGGKNIGHRYHLFRAFAVAHGDPRYEHIGVNTARVADGELKVIDSERRVRSFLNQLSRWSPTDLMRFGCMALRIRLDPREGFIGGRAMRRTAERRADPTVAECFTPTFCAEAWRPMSLLMNAAEPDEIHLGSLGTNVSMALDDYDQLQDGMSGLLERVAQRVPTRTGTSVSKVLVDDGAVVGLTIEGPDGGREDLALEHVVLALPAHASARLLAPHHAALAAELAAIRYFPTLVIVAEYDHDVFTPDVRSLRFDAGPLSNARAYGKDRLNVIRYTFSGRAARPHLTGDVDFEALLALAEAELGRHFPVAEASRLGFAAPPRALELCAYSQHHAARLERIAAHCAELPGLHLAGDYLRGASIEACFRAARDTVDALLARGSLTRAAAGGARVEVA